MKDQIIDEGLLGNENQPPILRTFRKFNNKEAIEETARLFAQHQIPFTTSDNVNSFDPNFANSFNGAHEEYYIQIPTDYFVRAEAVLKADAQNHLNSISKDYYLFGFTDDELMEVLTKPLEWTQLDVLLAQKLLKERGKEVHTAQLQNFKEEYIQTTFQPEKVKPVWIIAAYALATLGVFTLIGFFVGMVMGHHFLTNITTLPDGKRYYTYYPQDRLHGRVVLMLGAFTLIGIFLWNLY